MALKYFLLLATFSSTIAFTQALSLPLGHSSLTAYHEANSTQAPQMLFPRAPAAECNDDNNKLHFPTDWSATTTQPFDESIALKFCQAMCAKHSSGDKRSHPKKDRKDYTYDAINPHLHDKKYKRHVRLYCRAEPGPLALLDDRDACREGFRNVLNKCE